MTRVAGKVAIVTGAAMGIGKACAELLAAEGASVVATDREEEEGRNVVDALTATGLRAIFIQQDVGDEDQWKKVVDGTVKEFGRLDILVNNAGVGWYGDIENTTLESWHKLLRVNLDGVFLGMKHAIPEMRRSEASDA